MTIDDTQCCSEQGHLATDVATFFKQEQSLLKVIGTIIGYSDASRESLEDWREWYWHLDGEDILRMFSEKPPEDWYSNEDWFDNADCHEYTISSYGSRGEKYYLGSDDCLTFIMAYPEDDSWDTVKILVFYNKKKLA